MPEFYTLDYAFWVKLLVILLLGVNAAAFYLTGVFGGVKDLDPAKMPLSAKLVAASFDPVFAVIILAATSSFIRTAYARAVTNRWRAPNP